MDGNSVMLLSAYISFFVLAVYMIIYFIKGKNKNIPGFFKAFVNSVVMGISAYFPSIIVLAVMINGVTEAAPIIMSIIFATIFLVVFLNALFEAIENDFVVEDGFAEMSRKKMIYIIVILVGLIIIASFLYGMFAFPERIPLLFALFLMAATIITILVFKVLKARVANDPKKRILMSRIELYFGIGLAVLYGIFFLVLQFFP